MATYSKAGRAAMGVDRGSLSKSGGGVLVARASATGVSIFVERGKATGGGAALPDTTYVPQTYQPTGTGTRSFIASGYAVVTRQVAVSGLVLTSTGLETSTSQRTGQGSYPLVRLRFSFDDVSVANPLWTEVSSNTLRGFSVTRGRDNEQAEFDAGSASLTLDNRDRAYDPNVNSSIRPLNRVWLSEEFSGEVHDLFRGYVTSWDTDWPGGWADALAVANCADEFHVLSQMALLTTSPPRENYQDLVMSDGPVGYWDMNEDPLTRQRQPTQTQGEASPTDNQQDDLAPRRGDLRRAYPGKRIRRP